MWDWEWKYTKCLVRNDCASYKTFAYSLYIQRIRYTSCFSISLSLPVRHYWPENLPASEWIVMCRPFAEQVVLTPPHLYLSQFGYYVNGPVYNLCERVFVYVRLFLVSFFIVCTFCRCCRRTVVAIAPTKSRCLCIFI